jgi:hypothetical protein
MSGAAFIVEIHRGRPVPVEMSIYHQTVVRLPPRKTENMVSSKQHAHKPSLYSFLNKTQPINYIYIFQQHRAPKGIAQSSQSSTVNLLLIKYC